MQNLQVRNYMFFFFQTTLLYTIKYVNKFIKLDILNKEIEKNKASTMISSLLKMYIEMKKYKKKIKSAICIQAGIRGLIDSKKVKIMKTEQIKKVSICLLYIYIYRWY